MKKLKAIISAYWLFFALPLVAIIGNMIECHLDGSEFEQNAPYVESDGRVSNIECHKSCTYHVAYEMDGVARDNVVESYTIDRSARYDGRLAMSAPVHLWVSKSKPDYVSFSSPDEVEKRLQERIWSSIYVGYPIFVSFLLIVTYMFHLARKIFSKKR